MATGEYRCCVDEGVCVMVCVRFSCVTLHQRIIKGSKVEFLRGHFHLRPRWETSQNDSAPFVHQPPARPVPQPGRAGHSGGLEGGGGGRRPAHGLQVGGAEREQVPAERSSTCSRDTDLLTELQARSASACPWKVKVDRSAV